MRYRTVFISDVHLGSRGSKAEELANFLDSVECDYLFLVGDIIDIWAMRRSWYWPHEHSKILRKLIKLSKKTKVVYVPGNHDEMFREFGEIDFGEIEIRHEYTHRLAGGRRAFVLHGDRFDHIILNRKWVAKIGSRVYEFLIWFNRVFNVVRRRLGLPYWSLSGYLKVKAKEAVKVIDTFEEAVTTYAQKEGYDYVVCGHIHKAEIKQRNGVTYANCGDWVESCTAIVETTQGELKLLTNLTDVETTL